MSYNEKARKTCLEKYGNASSLHCGGKREEEIRFKAQRGNRERIEKAKNKFIEKLNKNNLELVSKIDDNKKLYGQKVKIKCCNCGKEKDWTICAKEVKCNFCQIGSGRSRGENEIIQFLSSFYKDEIILNSRNIISPYEIDIFLPKENIAIEFNGAYFHYKNNQNDLLKYNLCKEKKIKLIQIYDIQFYQEKNRILNAIKTCITYGGCVFLENNIHNNMFPLSEKIKIKETIEPKKIKLKNLKLKIPHSWENIEIQFLGGSILQDLEWSEYSLSHLFC